MQTDGHEAATAFFICLECYETFPKLRDLVHHRTNAGHTLNPITIHFSEGDSKGTKSSRKLPNVPECDKCREMFTTFHELVVHGRTVHGESASIVIKCEQCHQEVPPGEVHSQCSAGRVACPVCRQRFRSVTDLDKHSAENALSCDVCKVHVPEGLTLEDHWRASNQHPYCMVCNKGFRDSRTWTRHAWVCSLAARKFTRNGTSEDTGMGDHPEAHQEVAEWREGAANLKVGSTNFTKAETEWFLSGLKEASPVASEVSSGRSRVSTSSKHAEAHENPSRTPPPPPYPTVPSLGQLERDILRASSSLYAEDVEGSVHASDARGALASDLELVGTPAHEYGQHNIDHILNVLQDETAEPAQKRSGSTRSLLSPPSLPPATLPLSPESPFARSDASECAACDTAPLSLVANCSVGSGIACAESNAESGGNDNSDSDPPLLGCRRARERPVCRESQVTRTASWLDDLSQVTFLPDPYFTTRRATTVPEQDVAEGPRPEQRASQKTSWHCRSCLRKPCVDPVTAICGHVFCHSCIIEKLIVGTGCSVCQTHFFVPLDAAVPA
ncbi:hypothetical protein C8Q79DRAFT_1009623 [Trametes meyenii]|nr:hypothetical protein C8Q79DRAFT_1009623 [Trametes meyenii]